MLSTYYTFMLSHKHEDLDVLGYFAKKSTKPYFVQAGAGLLQTYIHRHVMNRYYRRQTYSLFRVAHDFKKLDQTSSSAERARKNLKSPGKKTREIKSIQNFFS